MCTRLTALTLAATVVLLAAAVAIAGTHAPWPADWNNWSDPPLWVTVGNPGNAGDTEVMWDGSTGYGTVGYTYKIGKFEVTGRQYCAFLNAVAKADPYGLYDEKMWPAPNYDWYGCRIQRIVAFGGYAYSVAEDWADRPVNYVSWGDAARFCNWLTNGQPNGILTGDPSQDAGLTEDGSYFLNGALSRADLVAITRKPNARYAIPTEDEWYKAAYHKNDGVTGHYWDYPMGTDATPSNDVVDPDPGNSANFTWGFDWGVTDYCLGWPYWRTMVGEFENSPGPYGTFDQGGNVWEWDEGIEYWSQSAFRVMRGGGYGYNMGRPTLHASERGGAFPENSDSTDILGFRIVEVPEPGALALVALCGPSLLRRRRMRA
jgi:formylglycine-generating enzyme required for sulfatase activity